MKIVGDHIAIFDDVFSEEFCKNVIEWFEKLDSEVLQSPRRLMELNEKLVRDGRGPYEPGGRKDISYFANIEHADFVPDLRNTLNECVKEYWLEYPSLQNYNLSNKALKIQKTPPHGGYHLWHHEHDWDEASRVLVWTVYLNDIPEGEGETEFLHQGLKVNPEKGKVCLFPATYTHVHRGNPPYSCDKYIATGWFYAQPH